MAAVVVLVMPQIVPWAALIAWAIAAIRAFGIAFEVAKISVAELAAVAVVAAISTLATASAVASPQAASPSCHTHFEWIVSSKGASLSAIFISVKLHTVG